MYQLASLRPSQNHLHGLVIVSLDLEGLLPGSSAAW